MALAMRGSIIHDSYIGTDDRKIFINDRDLLTKYQIQNIESNL